ncbi:hypothetical protein D2T29_03955 [Sinirhodobacter populi]|uniref:DUF1236 domain-containing protein n=1 Tax=Paenirhodobacter populi TaxID=2306993 RepID=A0A443KMP4_9RHOB|nr:hypothetical protein [Sinirhodobacter populi]RWR34061.1 hypothetical protein D2T29_03955 [Sinirhodobacter populi]
MRMKNAILIAATTAFTLGLGAPAVMAQQPGPQQKPVAAVGCQQGQKQPCAKQVAAKPVTTKPAPQTAPRVGDSARKAPPLQQAKNSRLPAPPKNQHYRVLDDRVVRVDDKTMKVVAVIGMVKDILK